MSSLPPRTFRFALCAVLGAWLTGCPGDLQNPERFGDGGSQPPGDSGDSGGGGTCPAGTDVEQVIAAHCASCHGGAAPQNGLDLSSNIAAHTAGVSSSCMGLPYVAPGDPDGSFLLQKMTAQTPACGGHMPPSPLMGLSADEAACVRAWISGMSASPGDAGATDAADTDAAATDAHPADAAAD
jgi:hypothetical protein